MIEYILAVLVVLGVVWLIGLFVNILSNFTHTKNMPEWELVETIQDLMGFLLTWLFLLPQVLLIKIAKIRIKEGPNKTRVLEEK